MKKRGVPWGGKRHMGINAAMIGCQGYYEWKAGHVSGWDLNAYATRDIALG